MICLKYVHAIDDGYVAALIMVSVVSFHSTSSVNCSAQSQVRPDRSLPAIRRAQCTSLSPGSWGEPEEHDLISASSPQQEQEIQSKVLLQASRVQSALSLQRIGKKCRYFSMGTWEKGVVQGRSGARGILALL